MGRRLPETLRNHNTPLELLQHSAGEMTTFFSRRVAANLLGSINGSDDGAVKGVLSPLSAEGQSWRLDCGGAADRLIRKLISQEFMPAAANQACVRAAPRKRLTLDIDEASHRGSR